MASPWILQWLLVVLALCQLGSSETALPNRIDVNTRWDLARSPYIATTDVIIPESVTVTVDPGVEIRLAAQRRLQVFGTISAKGTATQRITMTKVSPSADPGYVVPKALRLVYGFTYEVRDGWAQGFYKNRWRNICSRNRDWSKIDCRVACRELGFSDGNFTLLSVAENYTTGIVYTAPACHGNESSIFDCPGARDIEMGWDVCHIQELVGLYCWGANMDKFKDHWWGIEMYNATRQLQSLHTPNTQMNRSRSEFEFVDIMYAGVNTTLHNVAAFSASPYPPFLLNMRFMHNAFDAINLTQIKGPVRIWDSEFANNRGHGFHVQTAVGMVDLRRVRSHDNGGDGGVVRMMDYHWQEIEEEITQSDTVRLCWDDPSTQSPRFPFLIEAKGRVPSTIDVNICQKTVQTDYLGQLLTVSMLEAELDPEAYALIRIYDQMSSNLQVAFWNVSMRNDTKPPKPFIYQGVVSRRQMLRIEMTWVKSTRLTRCTTFEPCVRVILQVSVDNGRKMSELSVSESDFSSNVQRGLTVANPWTYVVVRESTFRANLFDAGLKIVNGSTDVFVNRTNFLGNERSGLNISTASGLRVVNASSFQYQQGFGMDVWHQYENQTRFGTTGYPRQTENQRQGILAVSCLYSPRGVTNFTVAFSQFAENVRNAIEVAPMLNMIGRITNNTFERHNRSVVLIDNGINFVQQRIYATMSVKYAIEYNIFQYNSGYFVLNTRLLLNSVVQSIAIMYNKFIDNAIKKAPGFLNPRSSVQAVVILSSDQSQLAFCRNYINNTQSDYEIGTHLMSPMSSVNATLNFWGTPADLRVGTWDSVAPLVFARLFDKIARYTLARIKYWPVLKERLLNTDKNTFDTPEFIYRFREGSSRIIGGPILDEFISQVTLEGGVYQVTRDIFVPLRNKLVIQPGARLEFDNSVGIFVEGSLTVGGTPSQPVSFTMGPGQYLGGLGSANHSVANGTSNGTDPGAGVNVRLADGRSFAEGRLEIQIDGVWGTVCDPRLRTGRGQHRLQHAGPGGAPGRLAAAACRAPARPSLHADPATSAPALPTDPAITAATTVGMFTCAASGRPGPGLRFTASNDLSTVTHLNLDTGGLLDYFRMYFSPGVQVDYNKHLFQNVRVSNCLSHGFVVLHNELYRDNRLSNCQLTGNLGNGVLIRSPLIGLTACNMSNNQGSGFEYNPGFTEQEAYEFRSSFPPVRKTMLTSLTASSPQVIGIQSSDTDYLVTNPSASAVSGVYRVQLNAGQSEQRLILTVVDFNPDPAWERVTIYDVAAASVNENSPKWRIPEDLVLFPAVSSGAAVTVEYRVKGPVTDKLALIVQSSDMRGMPEANYRDYYPPTKLLLSNCQMIGNAKGISITHYNDGTDDQLSRNDLFAPSYAEVVEGSSRIARIEYRITNCQFTGNGQAVFSQHNHVQYANNLWNYTIEQCEFSRNTRGGFDIDFPFVSKKFDWRYEEDIMHYVTYRNNKFAANQNTRMVIRGYNADINILNSEFTDNRCQRQSLIGLLGMEKRVSLSGNTITNNVNCTALVDFDIVSQTEFSPPVPASVTRNVIRGNACPPSSDPDGVLDSSTPTCAAVSVQGIQDVLVQRNIISNGYQTELIAGVQSSSLINSFNCTENYWGSVDIEVIRSRIFDYDSWNNFAVADFSRYLTTESLDSPVSSAVIPPRTIDFNRPFGGRIARDTRLQWRRTPYLVNRDITVMPGATLSIDAGVELQFYPNVGMLVLGRIDAMGSYNSPIKMRPVVKAAAAAAGRKRRKRRDTTTSSTAEYFAKYTEPESSKGGVKVSLERNGIRLVAGRIANEGFLQFYNTSAARWDIVCDNQFSEEVGRVVCRELGVETFNVIVRETYLYDHYVYGFDNQFVRKYFWMRTYNCKGTELSRAECTERLNYDSLMCGRRRGYVFLRCGQSNLQPGETYWGSIRVAHPAIEQSNPITGKPSHTPLFDTVTISNCASDGYKIIAPRQFVRVANTTVRDNLGTGYSIIVLNGDSANPETTPLVSFNPLVESSIPYNLVGLAQGYVVVDRLLLVFYKYSYETRACTKLFRSQVSAKRVALRFLQIQLYYDPFSKNSIELFNGDRFNTTELLAYISAANMTSSDDRRRTFRTRPAYDTMGVHIHASSAAPTNGFIAEVVTLPLSPDKTYPDLNNFMEHYVRQSVFTGNQEGGVHYRGVGEINPDFVAHFNQFERNGLDILNLTSRPVLFAQMQNGRYLDVSNNLVLNNFGGLQFDMWSTGLSKSAKSNITNNAIIRNTHGGALWISGNHYNMFKVTNNFFESNVAEMRDLVSIQGVLMKPFARNYFHRNVAGYIMNASGYEDLSTKSEFSWNGFYQNQALNWTRRSTIFLGSTKHQFRHNYFRNLANNFEIATGNMSIIRTADIDTNGNCLAEAWFCKEGWVKRLEFNKCICYRRDTVDARYNWWGEPYSFYAPRPAVGQLR
uniref:SRCR domain-containing protein n=1 Tax=Macrostomum lignano TaxID=282301 RepID=A0A1I8GIE5_9PLAT